MRFRNPLRFITGSGNLPDSLNPTLSLPEVILERSMNRTSAIPVVMSRQFPFIRCPLKSSCLPTILLYMNNIRICHWTPLIQAIFTPSWRKLTTSTARSADIRKWWRPIWRHAALKRLRVSWLRLSTPSPTNLSGILRTSWTQESLPRSSCLSAVF